MSEQIFHFSTCFLLTYMCSWSLRWPCLLLWPQSTACSVSLLLVSLLCLDWHKSFCDRRWCYVSLWNAPRLL